ncbi:hypothetical protein P9112_000488 [Eukaryota sp. TZLM1-RC]
MGIQGLTKVIDDNAPGSVREQDVKSYFGRKIAIDASTYLYQFLVAIRTAGQGVLTNAVGEDTSHIQGFLSRTTRLLELGMKPLFVFDGAPPELKSTELSRRREAREDATSKKEEAKEVGTTEDVEKYERRTVRVTRQHSEEVKQLLTLMGVPHITAPSEAEAECAALAKQGLVWATATEDMDALTFGTPILLRFLPQADQKKIPVREFHLDDLLHDLDFSMDQFIDLCILLGCDYTTSIKNIGRVRALTLMKEHGSLAGIIEHLKGLDSKRYEIPDDFNWEGAKELFINPDVLSAEEAKPLIKWKGPDEEGMLKWLVEEKGFQEDRVKKVIDRLKKARGSSSQGRLEAFFGPVTRVRKSSSNPTSPKATPKKKKSKK